MRKTCVVCEKVGVPKAYYAFCSQKCATQWALWTIGDQNEVAQVWCRRHGWVSAMEGCFNCHHEKCRRCGHERGRHSIGHDDLDLNGCQWSDFRRAIKAACGPGETHED